jgi:hypothetical protein
MKKSIIKFMFFALIVSALVGCWESEEDCDHAIYFYLKNGTASDIATECTRYESDSNSMIITSGETVEIGHVYHLGGCGDNVREDNTPPDMFINSQGFSIRINERPMSEFIWKRKYWDFVGGVRSLTYTLTITDDLLNDPELIPEP